MPSEESLSIFMIAEWGGQSCPQPPFRRILGPSNRSRLKAGYRQHCLPHLPLLTNPTTSNKSSYLIPERGVAVSQAKFAVLLLFVSFLAAPAALGQSGLI